ncbi:phage tail tape measure protein [Wolbachia endosymbiont of Folsomia candida]|uniref:phage tail tape measure protein n=1 Tax=Wolbachia endosymbiont of Folsomia candida TaxID=169402 RepID=UPI000AD645FB|nr:phage tail tape measure protein [Wolbachia endosymbiont of Folsomia candida]APR98630.1 phage tail tape measure protein [Wolbachia endosymbiont of Folsomia candida]
MSMLSIKIGAALDGSFNSTMKGSAAKLAGLGDSIRQLDSSMKSVSKFKQLNHEALETMKNWKNLEKKVKDTAVAIAKEKKEKKGPNKALKAEFDELKASATKAKEAYVKKRDALRTLNEEVRKSGKDIKSLVKDQNKLGSSIETLKGKYSKLGSIIGQQQSLLAKKTHYKSQVIETIGLAFTLAAPIKIAIDFESVMADIKAVVKFADNEIMELGQDLKKLSREIPLSAAELAKIATSGGRLRFSKEGITQFTKSVAKMAVNFGMTAEEIGSAVSKLSNIYGIGADKMEELGDTLNHLASNTTVDAKDMMLAMTVAGGAAKQFGLDIDQTAGLVNAFISLGKQPKKAAGVITDMLGKLQTVREQGDDFREALEEIGLDVEEFEENIKKDAQGTLLNLFETLGKVDKHQRSDILLRLFGSGSQDDIALIVENIQEYKKALDLLADKKEREKSLDKEYKDRIETSAKKLQLLKNSIAEVGMNLGSVMLPGLNLVSSALRYVTTPLAWFAEKCPIITGGIMGIISACILFKIVAVSGGYALALFQGAALTLKAILYGQLGPALMWLSTTILPAVVTGFRVLTAAMMSNPVGAVVAVLSVGAALVIANWQKVKDFFSNIWDYIKSIIKPIGELFKWIGGIYGKIFGLKELESENTLKIAMIPEVPAENSVSHGAQIGSGSIGILGKSISEELAESKAEIPSEPRKYVDESKTNQIQYITNNYNISIKAEPHQDIRSLADEVIRRIREQSRDVLFDTIEPIY